MSSRVDDRSNPTSRRGIAAIELAACLPIFALLVFGAIEASSVIFLKHSLHIAAHEAVLESTRLGSTGERGTAAAQMILDQRRIHRAKIEFPTGAPAAAERGETVIVEVSAPTAANSPLAGKFVANRWLSARLAMVKQ